MQEARTPSRFTRETTTRSTSPRFACPTGGPDRFRSAGSGHRDLELPRPVAGEMTKTDAPGHSRNADPLAPQTGGSPPYPDREPARGTRRHTTNASDAAVRDKFRWNAPC